MRKIVLFALALLGTAVQSNAGPIMFPDGYIPFSSVDYETSPDSNGVSLVVGEAKTLAGSHSSSLTCILFLRSPTIRNMQWSRLR